MIKLSEVIIIWSCTKYIKELKTHNLLNGLIRKTYYDLYHILILVLCFHFAIIFSGIALQC